MSILQRRKNQNVSWFAAGHQSVLLASIFHRQEDADSSTRQIPIWAHLPPALKLLLSPLNNFTLMNKCPHMHFYTPPPSPPLPTGLAEVCGVAVSYFPDKTGSVCLSSVGDERVNPSPSPARSAPREGPIHMVFILGPKQEVEKVGRKTPM